MLNLTEDLFELPSKGKVYTDLELVNTDSVVIRPLIASDQKTMAVAANSSYKLYSLMLKKLITDPEGLDVDKFLMSDATCVLFASRALSYPNEPLHLKFTCENCGSHEDSYINLVEELEVREAEEIEGFSKDFELSVGEYKVKAHLCTLLDEKKCDAFVNSLKSRGKIQQADLDKAYSRIAIQIDSVDGEDWSAPKKYEWVNSLGLQDLNTLQDELEFRDTGIVQRKFITCKSCFYDNEVPVRIGPEFFRPKSKRV